MRNINIGIIGFGTIGSGVVKILQEKSEELAKRTAVCLSLKKIADLDIESPRVASVDRSMLTTDAFEIINDPEIEIIIELMGGINAVKAFIMAALANKKYIVTANKALLAEAGDEIFKAAQQNGVDIGFEASIAGTIPIIKTIRESLVANQISSMLGIINGTSNYILSKMSDKEEEFSTVLKEAQAKGYAEADPKFDIEGIDAKHKLAILLSLAYGKSVNQDEIYCEGITKITPQDIVFAAELGYCVKLLAIAIKRGEVVEARLHPTLIPMEHPIAKVDSNYNAIHIVGDASGPVFLHGQVAGMFPTASAAMSDVVDIARKIMMGTSGRIPSRAIDEQNIEKLKIMPMDDIVTKYCIRFMVADKPACF